MYYLVRDAFFPYGLFYAWETGPFFYEGKEGGRKRVILASVAPLKKMLEFTLSRPPPLF